MKTPQCGWTLNGEIYYLYLLLCSCIPINLPFIKIINVNITTQIFLILNILRDLSGPFTSFPRNGYDPRGDSIILENSVKLLLNSYFNILCSKLVRYSHKSPGSVTPYKEKSHLAKLVEKCIVLLILFEFLRFHL